MMRFKHISILVILSLFLSGKVLSSDESISMAEPNEKLVESFSEMSAVPTDSTDKARLFKLLRHWVTVYSLYSNVDIGDKVDLNGLAGEAGQVAGDLAEVFLFNGELQAETYGFKESTFVNIYPVGILDGDHWMIEKLNEVSQSKFETKNAPYIKVEVHFTPIVNSVDYNVSVVLIPSSEITEPIVDMQNAINTSLSGNVYTKPKDAKEEVNRALFTGFEALKQLLGTTYVPDLAIRYDEELYTDGNIIEVWRADNETIMLEAVTQLSNTQWFSDVSGVVTNGEISIDEIGDQTIVLSAGGENISIIVRVKEFNLDIEEILKTILKEVINDRVAAARAKIDSLTTSQERLQETIVTNSDTYLQAQGYPNSPISGPEVYFEDIEDQREGTTEELTALKNDPTVNTIIESHRNLFISLAQITLELNIEVFLNSLVDDPQNLNRYAEQIKESSPELIADLIINLTRSPENRTQLKTIVVNFLNEQIESISEE